MPRCCFPEGAALCDALGTGADVRAGCAAGNHGSGVDQVPERERVDGEGGGSLRLFGRL